MWVEVRIVRKGICQFKTFTLHSKVCEHVSWNHYFYKHTSMYMYVNRFKSYNIKSVCKCAANNSYGHTYNCNTFGRLHYIIHFVDKWVEINTLKPRPHIHERPPPVWCSQQFINILYLKNHKTHVQQLNVLCTLIAVTVNWHTTIKWFWSISPKLKSCLQQYEGWTLNSNYSTTHPRTSIRKQGKVLQASGNSRIHKAVNGVESRFSTTVVRSALPVNVWKHK